MAYMILVFTIEPLGPTKRLMNSYLTQLVFSKEYEYVYQKQLFPSKYKKMFIT